MHAGTDHELAQYSPQTRQLFQEVQAIVGPARTRREAVPSPLRRSPLTPLRSLSGSAPQLVCLAARGNLKGPATLQKGSTAADIGLTLLDRAVELERLLAEVTQERDDLHQTLAEAEVANSALLLRVRCAEASAERERRRADELATEFAALESSRSRVAKRDHAAEAAAAPLEWRRADDGARAPSLPASSGDDSASPECCSALPVLAQGNSNANTASTPSPSPFNWPPSQGRGRSVSGPACGVQCQQPPQQQSSLVEARPEREARASGAAPGSSDGATVLLPRAGTGGSHGESSPEAAQARSAFAPFKVAKPHMPAGSRTLPFTLAQFVPLDRQDSCPASPNTPGSETATATQAAFGQAPGKREVKFVEVSPLAAEHGEARHRCVPRSPGGDDDFSVAAVTPAEALAAAAGWAVASLLGVQQQS